MKDSVWYKVCKLITWIVPMIMLGYCSSEYEQTSMMVVVFTYIIHFGMKFRAYINGRGRMSHEIWVFIGMIANIYFAVTMESEITYGDYTISNMPFKITMTVLPVLVMVSKVYTLYAQTDSYNEGAEEREETRIRSYEIKLDSDVESATRWVQRARTPQELRDAEMELERAKLKRDSYYRNKNR